MFTPAVAYCLHMNTNETAAKTVRHLAVVPELAEPARCSEHRAYHADNCPICGTAAVIPNR